ncbi:HPP family protein [Piscinibacter sp.]|jgi:CBS domain-containing membrane protein|uniref:HPP family protein n=1 Tax=Piscinibacter sp. TaxID=1903157 RepID=UPI00355AA9F0
MPVSVSDSLSLTAPKRPDVRAWLGDFVPGRLALDARERWRVIVDAIVGVLLTALLCRWLGNEVSTLPWLMAPIGASAVLVFGVPASPLAQPWAVAGGNMVSALVAVACVQAFGVAPWVAALAVGLAIAAMLALRCLHPPGGASALLVVLSGVHDPHFALFPVLANSLVLVAAGIAYNHATGRRYPHRQRAPEPAGTGAATPRPAFTEADLDAVLARYNQVLDVSRDDVRSLLEQAQLQAYRRRLGEIRCADIMSRDLASVEFGTLLEDAWALLRQRRIKALPVVDRASRLVGILTLADFIGGADLDVHRGWAQRLRASIRSTPTSHSDKAETVGQIMSRKVRVASADRPIADLLPMFAATDHHHIPIIDGDQRLVGIITQSDVVAALCRTH